jgi:hypothetical protein
MNKDKKYVFEIIVRETENLEKICSTITACDYTFEELKGRKADLEILNCKDILLDHLPKKELEKYFKDSKNHSDLKKSDTCNAPKNSIFGEEYRKKIAEGNWDKLQKTNIGYCTNSETNETPSNNADQDTAEKQYKKDMEEACKHYENHFKNPDTYGINTPQKTNNTETYYERVEDGEIFVKDKKTNSFYSVNMQKFKENYWTYGANIETEDKDDPKMSSGTFNPPQATTDYFEKYKKENNS